MDNEEIKNASAELAREFYEAANLKKGQIVAVGCSTSEVLGGKIGSNSSPEIGRCIFEGLYGYFSERGIFLAAQCCEHLNRAIVTERVAVRDLQEVNVIPQPKAGGSFATAAYHAFSDPVVLEEIRADAGIDIGGTLIGMHLKKVAVPLRLQTKKLGEAIVIAARTRPKFIGGCRAVYDDKKI